MNRLVVSVLVLLGTAVGRLPAQQNGSGQSLLADLVAKANLGDARAEFELGQAHSSGDLGLATNYGSSGKFRFSVG